MRAIIWIVVGALAVLFVLPELDGFSVEMPAFIEVLRFLGTNAPGTEIKMIYLVLVAILAMAALSLGKGNGKGERR